MCDARPLRVLNMMKKHKADYRVLGALEAQLPLLQELCSEQVHLLDTQAGTDIQQIPFPGDTTHPQGGFCTGVMTFTCNPDLIAVRP